MLEQNLKSVRRAGALFQTAGADFLLREQLATDPATVIHEYVRGTSLTQPTAAAANHLLYAILSDPHSLKLLRRLASRNAAELSDTTMIGELISSLEQHADRAVLAAIVRFGRTPEAEMGPSLDLLRIVIEALGKGFRPVAATENTPVTGHQPGTENTPVTGHQPGTENTPVTGHRPGTENTPVTGHQPGTENTPITERGVATENTPVTGHQPGTEHTPSTGHTPGTEHTPSTGHTPGTEHTPSTGHTPGTEHTPTRDESFGTLEVAHLGQFDTALRAMISFAVQLRQSGILYEPSMA